MKLPAGPLKVIFVSRASIVENRDRMAIRGAKLVPSYVVFVFDTDEKNPSYSITLGGAVTCHAAHAIKPAKLELKTDFRAQRPYTWIPSQRPGYPLESLLGINAWLETTDELHIDTKEKFNG